MSVPHSQIAPLAPPRARAQQGLSIANHLAQRRAVDALRERQRVVIASRTFGDGAMKTRVLVGGEYYDVARMQLDELRAGLTPDELELEPISNNE